MRTLLECSARSARFRRTIERAGGTGLATLVPGLYKLHYITSYFSIADESGYAGLNIGNSISTFVWDRVASFVKNPYDTSLHILKSEEEAENVSFSCLWKSQGRRKY